MEPLTNNGVSKIILLYIIHKHEDTWLIRENVSEYKFVDFLLYNKYIKISHPIIEILVAEYATKLFESILNYNYLCLSNYKLFYTIISKFFTISFVTLSLLL